MKSITLYLLLLFATAQLSAANYYVSAAGNDAKSGTSNANAWRTIDKVNAMMATFQPGDKIFFRRGHVFRGQLNWNKSGTAAARITVAVYGAGTSKAVISGAKPVTAAWTNLGGNL